MFPEIAELEFSTAASRAAAVTDLGKTYLFDFIKGDFVLLDGKLTAISDIQAVKVWVEKLLRTERFRYPIYQRDDGDEYGVTLEDLIGTVLPRTFVEAELKREITEAVTRHPKIQNISNLSTEQNASGFKISFQINLTDGTTVGQEVAIGG